MELEPKDESNENLRQRVRPSDWPTQPNPKGYDLIAIGGGTAGLVASAGAAKLGARVALIEQEFLGGDCLLTGCVPSKSLIHVAKVAHTARNASKMGISTGPLRVDFQEIMHQLRQTRAEISQDDSASTVSERGIDVLYGTARFVSPKAIELNGTRIRFKRAIICTGAKATIPSIPGLEEANPLTNETVFNLTELPKRIAIIGGGPIACELGQSFARLGARVTIIQRGAHLLSADDPAAGHRIREIFESERITVHTKAKVTQIHSLSTGYSIQVQTGPSLRAIDVDRIVVATGRTPNTESLELDNAKVAYTDRGITVDEFQRTSNRRIYAAGDATDQLKFTHAAYAYSEYATLNALAPIRLFKTTKRFIPHATYTDPEVAHVGLTYSELMKDQDAYDCFKSSFSNNDRSRTDRAPDGFVKLYAVRGKGKLVAATIFGSNAGELIGQISFALSIKGNLDQLGLSIHPYPTRSEAIRRAADEYMFRKVTPKLKKWARIWFRLMR